MPYVGAGRDLEEASKPVYFIAGEMVINPVRPLQQACHHAVIRVKQNISGKGNCHKKQRKIPWKPFQGLW